MIKTFHHKGLEKFFRKGSKAGIQPAHARKLTIQLTALDGAISPDDLRAASWNLHALHGEWKDHWSIWVSGNWRLTFKFEGQDAVLVDYQDYH